MRLVAVGRTAPGKALAALALGLSLIVGMAWAVASAPGSSPDEPFHLASIWCAWGPENSGCEVLDAAAPPAHLTVSVPSLAIESAHCAAFHPETSGACAYLAGGAAPQVPNPSVYPMPANNGSYPDGFYTMMRLLVLGSEPTSIVIMRFVQFSACLGLLVLAGLVVGPSDRWRLWLYWLIASVPLGLFVFASVNPSGMAIAAAGCVYVAAGAALNMESGARASWFASALAVIATIVATESRRDAALFCGLAVACAVIASVRVKRQLLQAMRLLPVVAVVAVSLLNSNTPALDPNPSLATTRPSPSALTNALNIPSLYLGDFATRLGWLDVAMPSVVWAGIGLALGAILGYGVGALSLRRAIALGIAIVAAVAMPLVLLQRGGYVIGEWVQPRYLMPIVMILVAILAVQGLDDGSTPNTRQLLWVALLGSTAHSVALHFLMRRYITGLDVASLNLDANREWWWDVPVHPMLIWAIGSVSFAALAVIVAILAGHAGTPGQSHQEETGAEPPVKSTSQTHDSGSALGRLARPADIPEYSYALARRRSHPFLRAGLQHL